MVAILSEHGLLKISGIDKLKLLQGQLTCNVESVTTQHCQLTAHCNPQGRIIFLSHLFLHENSFYMLMPRDMVTIAQGALKKYALFYKVVLADASDEWGSTALTTPANLKLHAIHEGIPAIYPSTSGRFLPHEINLHKLNAISFDKGCYTGQEIIARMHYRGKLKKQMYLASIIQNNLPNPGDVIYAKVDSTIKECGMVVDVCCDPSHPNHYQTLIVINSDDALPDHLFHNHLDGAYFEIENST